MNSSMNWRDVPIKTDSNGKWVTARDMGLSRREANEMFRAGNIKVPRKRKWKVKRNKAGE